MSDATSDSLCSLLDRMSWAAAAAEIRCPNRPVRLHALPPTMWVRPAKGVGGHKAAATGVLPAAVSWHDGPVRLADPADLGRHRADWTVDAVGRHLSGDVVLLEGEGREGRPQASMWPAHQAPVLSSRSAAITLEHLQEDGAAARWEMLQHLEDHAHERVGSIATAISREIADVDEATVAPALLDEQQLDAVVTSVVYGKTGTSSRILRCLDRCLDPATTRNVDPIRYLTTQIRRDLADEIRVAIGDPQVGSRVRRIARSLGTGASLEAIIDRYNHVHASDRISTSRAIRALTVAPSLESSAVRPAFEIGHG